MQAIKDDILKHGFIGHIVVQRLNAEKNRSNVIINGEHRYDALVQLGATEIPAIVLDVSDRTAKLLTLRLNREHGDLMPDKTAELLRELDPALELEKLAELTAMSQKELSLIMALDVSEPIPKEPTPVLPPSRQLDEMALGTLPIASPFEEALKDETKTQLVMSWSDVMTLVRTLGEKLLKTGVNYDHIYGITNGGAIPAALIQRFFEKWRPNQVKLFDVFGPELQGFAAPVTGSPKILIVDDIYDTGKTYDKVTHSKLKDAYRGDVHYATLLTRNEKHERVETAMVLKDSRWVVFPWETV